jgi:outer membrane protein assembly factor BamB
VDGTLKAIDMERGMVLWSYTTGAPLYTSSHYPIIPSIDGELYLYTNDGVKKHIWNLRELVQKSPFYVPDLRDNSGSDSSDSEEKAE